jgi:predicted NodU family carbamoyl transferase
MEGNVEHLSVGFHDRARTLLFSHFEGFKASIERVDRRKEEYTFQQQREYYANNLQQQLQQVAQAILHKNQSCRNIGQLSQNLHQFIADYIHQFVMKTNAL